MNDEEISPSKSRLETRGTVLRTDRVELGLNKVRLHFKRLIVVLLELDRIDE